MTVTEAAIGSILIHLGVSVTIALVCAAIVYFAAKLLLRRETISDIVLIRALLLSMTRPIYAALAIFVLSRVSTDFGVHFPVYEGVVNLDRAFDIGIFLCFIWFLLRWKSEVVSAVMAKTRARAQRAAYYMIGKAVTAVIILVAAITILKMLGVDMTAIWTIGGVGTVAIAFASKDIVSNLFGGLMLMLTRPFGLKDHIQVPTRNIDGWVQDIGWYFTVVDNYHRQPIYIPNMIFSGSHMVNKSRRKRRYIDTTFGLRYGDIVLADGVVQDIDAYLSEEEGIDQRDRYAVGLSSYGESGIEIRLRAYSKFTDWREFQLFKHALLLKISDIVKARGADFNFPTRTIVFNSEEEEERVLG